MCFFIGFHVNLPTTCIFTLFRNQQRVMFKLYDIKEQWAVRLRPRAFAKPRCSTPQKDYFFRALADFARKHFKVDEHDEF